MNWISKKLYGAIDYEFVFLVELHQFNDYYSKKRISSLSPSQHGNQLIMRNPDLLEATALIAEVFEKLGIIY